MDDIEEQDASDPYRERESMWDEAWPTPVGEGSAHLADEPDNLDESMPFPETVGTSDSIASVRDAEPYTPPIDPPVLPGGDEGIHVAVGFGTSSEEEASRESAPRGDQEIRDEALLALRQGADTTALALDVDVRQGVVYLRGSVPLAMDAERAATVISYVPGVVDVVDDTTLDPDAGQTRPL
jgi:hypothetical protein